MNKFLRVYFIVAKNATKPAQFGMETWDESCVQAYRCFESTRKAKKCLLTYWDNDRYRVVSVVIPRIPRARKKK